MIGKVETLVIYLQLHIETYTKLIHSSVICYEKWKVCDKKNALSIRLNAFFVLTATSRLNNSKKTVNKQ